MNENRKEPPRRLVSVQIRPFQPDDAQEWRRLRHALWPETTERNHSDDLAEYLGSPKTHVILVAEIFEGGLAGIAEIRIRSHADDCDTSPVGYLEGWIVEPEHRRCGIGRALIEAAEAWSGAHGCREFASDAFIENASSRAAHRALGFQEGPAVVRFSKTLGSQLPDDPPGKFESLANELAPEKTAAVVIAAAQPVATKTKERGLDIDADSGN